VRVAPFREQTGWHRWEVGFQQVQISGPKQTQPRGLPAKTTVHSGDDQGTYFYSLESRIQQLDAFYNGIGWPLRHCEEWSSLQQRECRKKQHKSATGGFRRLLCSQPLRKRQSHWLFLAATPESRCSPGFRLRRRRDNFPSGRRLTKKQTQGQTPTYKVFWLRS